MKNITASLLCPVLSLFLFLNANAQETVTRKKKVGNWFEEQYQVLKSQKSVKHGLYEAKNHERLLASGNYENGQPVGEWKFYNLKGDLVQIYDHTKRSLTFSDTTDAKFDGYSFGQDINPGDVVVPPVKMGGKAYTIFPLMSGARPALTHLYRANGMGNGNYDLLHLFNIDAQGNLTSHQIVYTLNGHLLSVKADDKDLPQDYTHFIPATINGKAVASTVSVKGKVTTNAAINNVGYGY
ncbi:hypothetical protein LLH06_05855 [Mucilaginibacter daejeonensis]|uniref:hypothetical protein n=1 Tax=Mucilaginibacter daejeonensis TaxID=398049 RepID=UPI001D179525|nr:hypothetical protein [Mucilaginibacter daejeonensis]UEG54486.1 hypothetical protein LLH06_05855 [Mucilaginibacter daejeonensis]